jgi:hypothetical protein
MQGFVEPRPNYWLNIVTQFQLAGDQSKKQEVSFPTKQIYGLKLQCQIHRAETMEQAVAKKELL